MSVGIFSIWPGSIRKVIQFLFFEKSIDDKTVPICQFYTMLEVIYHHRFNLILCRALLNDVDVQI